MILNKTADGTGINSNTLALQMKGHPELRDKLHVVTSWGPLPVYPGVVNSELPASIICNKCEFTMGKSVDGIDNTVGFRLGAYKGLDPQDNHSTSTSDVPVTGAAITDPNHYRTLQHFTSEIFKIEIQNLPRQFGFAI
ncbi:uncharacterized protein LOC119727475 [Patiria miniata]|uniref:Uncharacterized protein n=1 Tax=Patiria miniata TaxID=46514 RepID=A0A913ZW59_PATMI|nr:uncharacterized protein LOC119727475 [Patiria miniata]